MQYGKWLALSAALMGGFGYASGQSEWLRFGIDAAAKMSESADNWREVLPEAAALAGKTLFDEPQQKQQTQKAVAAKGSTYSGRVSRVHDGDTLHVTDTNGRKHKIRMAYIDAPELQQAYGTRSRDRLVAEADGEKVRVRVFDTDRYGREVAQVWRGQTDLNLLQIREGAAWHFTNYAKKQQPKSDYTDYAAAEREAKQARNGLWKDRKAQAPWDFRRQSQPQQGRQQNQNQWFGLW